MFVCFLYSSHCTHSKSNESNKLKLLTLIFPFLKHFFAQNVYIYTVYCIYPLYLYKNERDFLLLDDRKLSERLTAAPIMYGRIVYARAGRLQEHARCCSFAYYERRTCIVTAASEALLLTSDASVRSSPSVSAGVGCRAVVFLFGPKQRHEPSVGFIKVAAAFGRVMHIRASLTSRLL